MFDASRVGVLFFAMFAVPQLMRFVPDFDPLLIIVGVFGVLGLLQHLGGPEAATEEERANLNARKRPAQRAEPQEESTQELVAEAQKCLEQNSWTAAADRARKAIDKDPECVKAWEVLATSLKWQGMREEALEAVQKARDFYELESAELTALAAELTGPSQAPGAAVDECETKAHDFKAKRQFDLAFECYTKALEALGDGKDEPRCLILLRGRAECAQQLQDWSVCRQDASILLEKDPNDTQALLMRAASNEALEKFAAALEDARKLLSLGAGGAAANRIVQNCRQALR
jgi:tetratricopeptide (TPR) repeat protein